MHEFHHVHVQALAVSWVFPSADTTVNNSQYSSFPSPLQTKGEVIVPSGVAALRQGRALPQTRLHQTPPAQRERITGGCGGGEGEEKGEGGSDK